MKDYFKLGSNNYANYGLTKCPKLGEQSVMQGRLIDPQKLPPLHFEHNFPDEEAMPNFLTGGTVLASKALIDLLNSIAVKNFQAFPASLINPHTQAHRDDYFLFNALGLVSAANLSASTYDEIMKGNPEGIDLPLLAFNDLVIDSSKVRELDMFRLAEEPISLIVSERVVDALQSNRPPQGWGISVEQLEST